MKKSVSQLKVFLWALMIGISQSLIAQKFVHPGIPFTAYDLAQLKANKNTAPWSTGYAALAADGKSQLTYSMQGPYATVTRAPQLNNTAWISDMQAIHNLTFMWVFTGDSAYARKATNILDAWAVTNTTWGGGENMLDIGDQISYLVPAADILKSMFPGWTAANTAHVNNYFANVLYPTSWVPNPLRDHNKGAIQLKIAISIAAFLDDVTKWNQAIEVYRMDAGGGLRNSLANGEVGDAGRDDHWSVQIEALGWSAEVAFKQGVDMFAELGNRMLAIGELYNHYSMHPGDLTFVPFGGYAQYYTTWGILPGYNHNASPLNNIIHAAYSLRKGIPTPYTDEMLAKSSPSGLSFLYLKTSDPSTAIALDPIVYPGDNAQPVTYFSNIDIGNPGMAGTASYNSGTWTAQGAGIDPANSTNYTFKPFKGDVGIVAKIEGNSLSSCTSGLMIRESLSSTSNYVSVSINGSGGMRLGASGHSAATAYAHGQPKASWWLKLERVGNRVFTYHSQDGVNWTNNALYIMTIPTDAYIGFYTVSNNTSALNTATFTHVAINNTFPVGSPEINSPTSATATIGAAFNFSVTASGSPTTFTASGMPVALRLDAATGVFSGTPTTLGQSVVTLNATNANGTSGATLIINVINNTAPAVPAGLTANVVNTTNIRLTWNASANATSYSVKRSPTAGGPYTTIQSGITGTTFIDAKPAYEINNYYVVTALTGALESGVSNEVFASVPPAIPSNLSAISKSGEVDLRWDIAAGAVTYQVNRGTTSGGPYTSIATVTTNSYSDIGVTNGSPYYYVVSSIGNTKQSGNSAEVFGVPGSNSSTWSSTPIDTAWNVAANWVEGSVPATLAVMTFNASADSVLVNNTTGLETSRIQFNTSANAYKISGNSLVIKNDLVNNSLMPDTLTMPVTLTSQLNVYANTGRIALTGVVSGTGSLLKTGSSELVMTGANTYSGNTVIRGLNRRLWGATDGIQIRGIGTGTSGTPASGPLGTGTIIFEGGCIYTSASSTSAATLYNDIQVEAGKTGYFYERSGDINLYGKLKGAGTIWSDGSDNYAALHLKGDNSGFTGTFVAALRSGQHRIKFDAPESGSANATWNLDANSTDCQSINFASGTLNFGALMGRGLIRNDMAGNVTISIGALGTNTNYSGTMSSASAANIINVEKVGTGALIFSGNQNYGGTTTVKSGTFLINNSSTSGVFISPITANGGSFGGTGICSSTVTIGTGSGTGASFVPGADGTIGKFTTTALATLNSDATYKADVNSNNGISDTIVANGFTINNAVLSVNNLGSATPALGTKYMIVKNTSPSAITGTFKNLPEFGTDTINGMVFRITYIGGDGNDIQLLDDRTITKAVPAVPAKLTASAISSTSVGIKWSKSPASEYVTSYSLKRSATDGGPYTVLSANLKDTSYVDKNLAINTIYYYVASATNYLGEGVNSVQDSAKTPFPVIPPAPTGVISAAGDTKVSLSWSEALEAASYTIKRAASTGGPYTTIASAITATLYTDNTVVNGTAYYYVVSAVNVTGESANSTEVTATPTIGGFSYWPFNETSGITATDVWGARNATLNGAGATWINGISGNGLRLDGTSTGYSTLPVGVVSTLAGDFTVSAWVKLDALQTNQRIFDFGTSSANYMFVSQNAATTIRYGIKVGSGTEQGITSNTLSLAAGRWIHVAVVLSGSTHTLYINGTSVVTSTGITYRPSGLGSTTMNYFGKSQNSTHPFLKGILDEFRIYTRALSASEISAIVSGIAPSAPTNLTATGAIGAIALNWTAVPLATAYNIKRSQVAGGPYTTIASNVTATTYTDATATYGTYYYIVTSGTSTFESAPSNEASIVLIPAVPTTVIATGWNTRVDLSWAATGGAVSYDIKRASTNGGPYTAIANVTATTYSNTGLVNATQYYYVIAAVNNAGSSANSTEVNATPASSAIADVWSHTDVGNIDISGNAGYFDGVFSVYATGGDMWGATTEGLHMLYQPLSRDIGIVARILTQDNTHASAKAGIIFKENLTMGSRHICLTHKPSNGLEFIVRASTGGTSAETAVAGTTIPSWVRIVRSGNLYAGYYSADGFTWTSIGSKTATLGTTPYVGLVNCSLNNTVMNASTFDYVKVSSALPTFTHATDTIGIYGTAFSYQVSASNDPYYRATGLPAGLSINMSNGIISGTPTVTGTFSVVLSAANAMGVTTANKTLVVNKQDQTIAFNDLAGKKINDLDFDPGATASSGLPVMYSSSDTTVVTIVNGWIHIVAAGTCTIYAYQAGNSNYNVAPQASQVLMVHKLDQTITFALLGDKLPGDNDFDAGATASSGLPVRYTSSDTTVTTIVDGKIHITGVGATVITAFQDGNNVYYPADAVTQTFTVLPLNLIVQYKDGDNGRTGNNSINPYLKVVNAGNINVAYNELTVRYWFTAENFAGINAWIDWAQIGNNIVSMLYVPTGQPRLGSFGYMEYSFTASAGMLLAGSNSGPVQSRFANKDWTNFNETDDYSYSPGATSYVPNNHITLYRNGFLVWGTEPEIGTPNLNVKVYSENKNVNTNTSSIQTYLKINNEGNVPVSYKDLSVRYWFTSESNTNLNYWIDYAKLGNSKVYGQFVTLNSPFVGADTYFELTIDSVAGTLYPLSNTGNIQYRIFKADWSNFKESDDYSYKPKAPFAENDHITVYYKGELIYGIEPAIQSKIKSAKVIDEQPETFRFTVYPNPVADYLTITFDSDFDKGVEIQLFNDKGQKLFFEKIWDSRYVLDMNNKPSGVYLLKINCNDKIVIKKVIKK